MASSHVPLAKAIEIGARLAMSEGCAFTGVSGDFDACSNVTRQVYEKRSAEAFGVTLDDYYAMDDAAADRPTIRQADLRSLVSEALVRQRGQAFGEWVVREGFENEALVDLVRFLHDTWQQSGEPTQVAILAAFTFGWDAHRDLRGEPGV